jgi:two-component system, NarL family, nitrate/nitrite response regulator NarL
MPVCGYKVWLGQAMSGRIRVGVVDQHPLFRAGVIHTLGIAGTCEVVAEGSGEVEALRIAAEHAPDVLLFDPHSEFRVETVQRLASEFPTTRTIIFTVNAERPQAVAALQAGAVGYLLKGASGTELIQTIGRVHAGERYVDPSLAAMLLMAAPEGPTKRDPLSTLTKRELQVLHCLGRGRSNKEIARELNLSEKTVKHHLGELFSKLQVRNRVEAAILSQGRERTKPDVTA